MVNKNKVLPAPWEKAGLPQDLGVGVDCISEEYKIIAVINATS